MTPDLPITTRNLHAKIVLISGTRVALREVLFGEQVRLAGNRFASEVTPMQHGRFRLMQDKGGMRVAVDLMAQAVDRIARRGGTGGLEPMVRPAPEDADVFELTHSGIPYRGKLECFNGRGAINGTDEATGAARTILLKDVQIMEVRRRKPEPRVVPADEVEAYYARPDEVAEAWAAPGTAETAESLGTPPECGLAPDHEEPA